MLRSRSQPLGRIGYMLDLFSTNDIYKVTPFDKQHLSCVASYLDKSSPYVKCLCIGDEAEVYM